jgi:hypothetical protein
MTLEYLIATLGTLAGLGALVAFLVNAGKAAGIVRDGQAPAYATGLNLAALVGLYAAGLAAPELDLAAVDHIAGTLAQIGTLIAGLVVQLASSRAAHALVRGTPIIGARHG